MGLALAVLLIADAVFFYWLGRRSSPARGLEMLGEAELRNRKRITGLSDD